MFSSKVGVRILVAIIGASSRIIRVASGSSSMMLQ